MVVQTIRLADRPNLFRHQKGAKVIQRDADGYADDEWAGVIVDGTWRGDPSGGAYKETYRIKRGRGDYFDADEHSLLKRFATGQCLQHATEREERPWARRRPEAIARPAATESGPGSRVPGIRTHMACITSIPGAMRSGSRCDGSRAFIPDADKPHLHSDTVDPRGPKGK